MRTSSPASTSGLPQLGIATSSSAVAPGPAAIGTSAGVAGSTRYQPSRVKVTIADPAGRRKPASARASPVTADVIAPRSFRVLSSSVMTAMRRGWPATSTRLAATTSSGGPEVTNAQSGRTALASVAAMVRGAASTAAGTNAATRWTRSGQGTRSTSSTGPTAALASAGMVWGRSPLNSPVISSTRVVSPNGRSAGCSMVRSENRAASGSSAAWPAASSRA